MTAIICSVIGFCLSAFAIGVTIYNAKKKETKEDVGTLTTLVTGIEFIKEGISEIKRDTKDLRAEVSGIDKRLTCLEVLNGIKGNLKKGEQESYPVPFIYHSSPKGLFFGIIPFP